MPDVTVVAIDDMEGIYGGVARRARAELGVTACACSRIVGFADASVYGDFGLPLELVA